MNRRRPFYRTPDYTGEPLSSLEKKELMNLAYYLYQVTDGMHNEQIFNNENAYKMLFSLVKLLGVAERFTELLELRTQDLEFDKYIGGTEANIASAFEEAQATDQILLFDEADSFFAERENAVRSKEKQEPGDERTIGFAC